jgi:hypothetical protein
MHAHGVVTQHLVAADMDQCRRRSTACTRRGHRDQIGAYPIGAVMVTVLVCRGGRGVRRCIARNCCHDCSADPRTPRRLINQRVPTRSSSARRLATYSPLTVSS